MKTITVLDTVSGRKQLNFGASFFLLAHNSILTQFIQLSRCLKLEINPRSQYLALNGQKQRQRREVSHRSVL